MKLVFAAFALVLAIVAGATTCGRPDRAPPPVDPAAQLDPLGPAPGLREVFESLPEGGRSRLRILDRNAEAWAERWRLVASAESSIDVAYFILDHDVFGASLLGSLLERARAGVAVRVLLDGFGTDFSNTFGGPSYLDALARHTSVRMYRPLHERLLAGLLELSPSVAFASEHDKIILVDGRRTLIGGRNIAAAYFAAPGEIPHTFEDIDVWIESEAVALDARRAFAHEYESARSDRVTPREDADRKLARHLDLARLAMAAWLAGEETPVEAAAEIRRRGLSWLEQLERHPSIRGALRRERPQVFEAEARLVDAPVRFGSSADPLTRAIVRFANASRRSIFGQTPYLVLSEEGVAVLENAGRKGVATTIVTNSPVSTDNALSQAFFLEQWPQLLARVPGLELHVGGTHRTLHAKVASFDGQVALIGTYNLDPTSMTMNGEAAVAVWSRAIARRVTAAARAAIESGPPQLYRYRIRRDDAGRPLLEDGEPVVEFGPRDHASPASWKKVLAYWTALRAARALPDRSPFL